MSVHDLTTPEACKILQGAGYRVTAPRRAVVEAVIGQGRNFTGADILAEVTKANRLVGRATVFRTLEVLVALGLVGRIRHPDGGLGYVVCPRGHHHHAVCSSCGLVVDLPGCPLDTQASKEAKAAGFRLQGHYLEYYGLCNSCNGEGNN